MTGFCFKAHFLKKASKSPCHPLPCQFKVAPGTSPPTQSTILFILQSMCFWVSYSEAYCPLPRALPSSSLLSSILYIRSVGGSEGLPRLELAELQWMVGTAVVTPYVGGFDPDLQGTGVGPATSPATS